MFVEKLAPLEKYPTRDAAEVAVLNPWSLKETDTFPKKVERVREYLRNTLTPICEGDSDISSLARRILGCRPYGGNYAVSSGRTKHRKPMYITCRYYRACPWCAMRRVAEICALTHYDGELTSHTGYKSVGVGVSRLQFLKVCHELRVAINKRIPKGAKCLVVVRPWPLLDPVAGCVDTGALLAGVLSPQSVQVDLGDVLSRTTTVAGKEMAVADILRVSGMAPEVISDATRFTNFFRVTEKQRELRWCDCDTP